MCVRLISLTLQREKETILGKMLCLLAWEKEILDPCLGSLSQRDMDNA